MSGFDYFLLAWWGFSILLTVATVGKPRKPLEPLAAAIAVAIIAALIVGLLVSRGAL